MTATTSQIRIDDIDVTSDAFSILSLDVFDTLITRKVAQPSHVFALLEQELCVDNKMKFSGFARRRLFAERRAREIKSRSDPHADVTLNEIYTELRRDLQLGFSLSQEIANREMSIEKQCAVAVPHTRDLIARARSAGKKVIAVSDNYMPAHQILDMFEQSGIDGFSLSDIFVSCEYGGTKANGRIWAPVLTSLGVAASEVLHVGDHEDADGNSPTKAGISSVVDSRMNRSHRFPINTTPSVLPHSRLEAVVRDEMRNTQWDPIRVMGRTSAAMIVASQILLLDQALQRDPTAHVYFAARDGYLARGVWNKVRASHGGPSAEYLHVSRSVLWRTNPKFKPSKLIGPRESLTLARLAHRLEMPSLVELVQDCDTETELTAEQAWKIIEDHRTDIDKVTRSHRDMVVEYLESKGMFRPGRHFVVDLGWTGSSIADLAAVVHAETNGEAVVEGLFLGLYWDATHIRTRFPMTAFAIDDMSPGDQQRALLASHSVIEALITAPHGSVVGFRRQDGVVQPVLAEQRVEQEEYSRVIGAVCEHAAETAEQIVLGTHSSGVTLNDVTGESVWASIMQTIHTPRPEEIDVLGSIRLVIAIDHADDGIHLVPQQWPEGDIVAVHDSLLRGHWMRATVASPKYRNDHATDIQSMINVWPEVGPDWVRLTSAQ